MLIDLTMLLKKYNMQLKGVIHGGAHECEEMKQYKENGLAEEQVIWFEANPSLIKKMETINPKLRIFNYALLDTSDETLKFHVTNNFQSSSVLPLKTHRKHYPSIKVKETIEVHTITMNDFFDRKIVPDEHTQFNFLNLDIQGAELQAVKGFGERIKDMEMLYLEVNKEELYQGCGLIFELDEYLAEMGFIRLDTKWVPQGWGDAFYLRRDIYRQKIKEKPSLVGGV